MSAAWFIVTTSASRPATTDWICLLEPPWDWLIVIFSPAVRCQWAAKAGLMSLYNSRATS